MLVTKRLHKLLFTYKTLSRILKNTNTNIKNAAVKAVKLLIVLNISLISCKIFYGGTYLKQWRDISQSKYHSA